MDHFFSRTRVNARELDRGHGMHTVVERAAGSIELAATV